jgi:hypothetical protein
LTGNQSITLTPSGDVSGTASGATSLTPTYKVIGLNGSPLPANATGSLVYLNGSWQLISPFLFSAGTNISLSITGATETISTTAITSSTGNTLYLQILNNLSDLNNTSTARTTLGLNATSSLAVANGTGIQSSYTGSTYNPSPNCLTSVTVSATGTVTGTSGTCSGGSGGIASTTPWTLQNPVVASGTGIATISTSTLLAELGAVTSTSASATGTAFYVPLWNASGTSLTATSSIFQSSSTGNVGIGTTQPSSTLHVVGSLQVSNSSGKSLLVQDSNNPPLYAPTSTNEFEVDDPVGIPSLIISSTSIQNYEGNVVNKKTIVANYQILNTDNNLSIYNTGTSSITLVLPTPTSTPEGQQYVISDANGVAATYPILVTASGSSTIEGTTTIGIYNNYGSLDLTFEGMTFVGSSTYVAEWDIN